MPGISKSMDYVIGLNSVECEIFLGQLCVRGQNRFIAPGLPALCTLNSFFRCDFFR